MVRISTVYDKVNDTNMKVFMVRGDESYARSTDTIFTVNTFDNSAQLEGYRIGCTYNVLRDIGTSTVSIYDGDVLLTMSNWSDESSATTIGNSSSGGFILAYGIEHELYAQYRGNAQCIGSKSKKVIVKEDIPSSFQTSITFSNNSTSIATGSNATFTVTVKVNGQETSATHSRPVLIYVDDEYKTTINTGSSSNTANGSISGLTKGVHKIKAVVEYDGTINYAENEYEISIGQEIRLLEYPKTFLFGAENKFTIQVLDEFGVPVSGEEVILSMGYRELNDTTDSDGIVEFEEGVTSFTLLRIVTESMTQLNLDIPQVDVTGVTVTGDDYVCGYTAPETFDIAVSVNQNSMEYNGNTVCPLSQTLENIALKIGSDVIYTDSNGQASYTKTVETGSTTGTKTFTVIGGTITKNTSYDVAYQYWDKGHSVFGRKYDLLGGKLETVYDGYKITSSTSDPCRLRFKRDYFRNNRINFDIVSGNTGYITVELQSRTGQIVDTIDFEVGSGTDVSVYYNNQTVGLSIDDDIVATETATYSATASNIEYICLKFTPMSSRNNSFIINKLKYM